MPQTTTLNSIAADYLKIVLSLGEHEDGYVDAYFGDPELLSSIKKKPLSLDEIITLGQTLISQTCELDLSSEEPIIQLRKEFLQKQSSSVVARARMNQGEKFSFDEEASALYDTVPPRYSEGHFQSLIENLNDVLPGKGDIIQRYHQFKQQFVIPVNKLDQVFKAAINESRERTKQFTALQQNEKFHLEYVTNKVWSGYNWYKGNSYSLIQINTDLPIYIDRAIDLAAHEGYPGHHVYNALLENQLYRSRDWQEFSVYPLFSPQSVIAEGTANYGIGVVFPNEERIAFEREVLFPIAGLPTELTETYYQIHNLLHGLNYVNNEVGRLFFPEEIDKTEALRWLREYMLYEPERAEQRLKFIEANGAYVMNYNWGEDLVKQYVERNMTNDTNKERWRVFIELLSSPRLPSGLM